MKKAVSKKYADGFRFAKRKGLAPSFFYSWTLQYQG